MMCRRCLVGGVARLRDGASERCSRAPPPRSTRKSTSLETQRHHPQSFISTRGQRKISLRSAIRLGDKYNDRRMSGGFRAASLLLQQHELTRHWATCWMLKMPNHSVIIGETRAQRACWYCLLIWLPFRDHGWQQIPRKLARPAKISLSLFRSGIWMNRGRAGADS